MQAYQQGENTKVTFNFQDDDGNALVPTSLSVRILDQDDNVVSAPENVSLPDDPSQDTIDISIAAEENIVGQAQPLVLVSTGQTTPVVDLRIVELTVTTEQGSVVLTQVYMIRARTQLVILQNSFQTFWSAVLRAQNMPNVDSFTAADKDSQIAGLTEAYLRMIRFGYFVRWPQDYDFQAHLSVIPTREIFPQMWPVMPLVQFNTYYPEVFREALRRAQVIEANAILENNPLEYKRQLGVVSEKIGESTTDFRQSTALDLGLSRDTMKALTGYINIRATLTRAV